jgi:hypothetical protein
MNNKIKEAIEWKGRIIDLLPSAKHPEYIKERLDLLDWLIEQAKENQERV